MPHLKLDEKKIITTIVERNGNRLRFGLTRGSEITTEEGDQISAGHIPVFETKNMKSYLQNKRNGFEKRKQTVFNRFITYNRMGIAATYNRLHAPLQGPNRDD